MSIDKNKVKGKAVGYSTKVKKTFLDKPAEKKFRSDVANSKTPIGKWAKELKEDYGETPEDIVMRPRTKEDYDLRGAYNKGLKPGRVDPKDPEGGHMRTDRTGKPRQPLQGQLRWSDEFKSAEGKVKGKLGRKKK